MAKIPLNYFKRKSIVIPYTTVGRASAIYEAPFERASVLISALATNTSSTTQTVYAALSTRGTPITTSSSGTIDQMTFVSNFPIAPYDTVNIVVNKLVLGQYDNLFVWTPSTNGDVNLTLSILETVNTQ